MEECRDELFHFMKEDELKDCIILVMANKQDLPNAMTVQEITEQLGLNKLPANREWCKSNEGLGQLYIDEIIENTCMHASVGQIKP